MMRSVLKDTHIRLLHFTWQRNVLAGAGLAYAWEQEKYWHMPLVVLAPSVYAGYHIFKNRDKIRAFLTATV